MTFVDPFVRLKGMPGILEKILDCIDFKNLNKVQQVSKVWNETVKMGFSWRRQLQKMVSTNIVWEEIYHQLPADHGTFTDELTFCADKDKYRTIFTAAKKLDRNWKTGCSNRRIIEFDPEDIIDDDNFPVTDLHAMSSQSLAVSTSSGNIKVFDRKDLSHVKDLQHGEGLRYVNFIEGDYLISASASQLKVWDKAKQLLQTIELALSRSDAKSFLFGSGHVFFVCWDTQNKLFLDGAGAQDKMPKLFIWRLMKPPSQINGQTPSLQFVYQEQMASSTFAPRYLLVSENYIVTLHIRSLASETEDAMIEVRSTSDFSVVYSTSVVAYRVLPVGFVKDTLAFQILLKNSNIIKLLDCDQRCSRDIDIGAVNHIFLRSNSRFALVFSNMKMRFQSFDLRPLLSADKYQDAIFKLGTLGPLEGSQICRGCKVKGHLSSFVMDELSALHYQMKFDETTGKVSLQLILFDFLEFSGDSPILSCCVKCDKPGQDLKRCSRCHRARYCNAECQRNDWWFHKMVCYSRSVK